MDTRRRLIMAGTGATAVSLAAPPIGSASSRVDVVLHLMLDASGSMYTSPNGIDIPKLGGTQRDISNEATAPNPSPVFHWMQQRDGHVAALLDPEVQALLLMQQTKLYVGAWAGKGSYRDIVDPKGVMIEDMQSISSVVDAILRNTPTRALPNQNTVHHAACDVALARYRNDSRGKLIIDISTDEGVPDDLILASATTRQSVIDAGGTVNVFAVDMATKQQAVQTLHDLVRTGFLMHGTFDDYARGIKEKMLAELMM